MVSQTETPSKVHKDRRYTTFGRMGKDWVRVMYESGGPMLHQPTTRPEWNGKEAASERVRIYWRARIWRVSFSAIGPSTKRWETEESRALVVHASESWWQRGYRLLPVWWRCVPPGNRFAPPLLLLLQLSSGCASYGNIYAASPSACCLRHFAMRRRRAPILLFAITAVAERFLHCRGSPLEKTSRPSTNASLSHEHTDPAKALIRAISVAFPNYRLDFEQN